MLKVVSEYFLDVSKLTFGGVVLTTILEFKDFPQATTLIISIVTTLVFLLIGIQFHNLSEDVDDEMGIIKAKEDS